MLQNTEFAKLYISNFWIMYPRVDDVAGAFAGLQCCEEEVFDFIFISFEIFKSKNSCIETKTTSMRNLTYYHLRLEDFWNNLNNKETLRL